MSSSSREFFTVDLCGLRTGLKARAASQGLTESALARRILATALATEESDSSAPSAVDGDHLIVAQVKLSVRLVKTSAHRLDHNARSAGLSRGVYLARLIDGAPPVVASSDRAAMFSALNASSTELALLSRDINCVFQPIVDGRFRGSWTAFQRNVDAISG